MDSTKRSVGYGGNGGESFDDSHDFDAWGPIRRIIVRHGNEIDAIGVVYANGTYLRHGGGGGNETVIDLAADERVHTVRGAYDSRLHQISFETNKRRYPAEKGKSFGTDGGTPFEVK